MRERSIEIGGVRLRYVEGADAGPPLVLLHGGLLGWEEFLPLLPELAVRWRVLAPDFSGHGGSGRRERYSYEAWVEETIGFLDACAGGPAVLAGHSLGGMAAIGVAARRPDLVRALVLLDSFIYPETFLESPFPELFAGIAALRPERLAPDDLARQLGDVPLHVPGCVEPVPWGALPGIDAAFRRWFATRLQRADPGVLAQIVSGAALADYDPGSMLPGIACPVLLVQGDPAAGGLLTDADVARARPHLSGATHAHLEGVGHLLHLQDPAPVRRALLWFLESLRGGPDGT